MKHGRDHELLNTSNGMIKFSKCYGNHDLRLIAVTEEMLSSLDNNSNLSIIGTENQNDAVLCTENESYTIKKVEILLCPVLM